MTDLSEVKASLDDLKKAGVPVREGKRDYISKRMTGFNQEVYSAWIERWANNAAVNYPIISDSWGVRFLFKSAINIPAIVVGIGPSLDDNYKELLHAREHALIIATDAALRPLLRHGVKPDLVVTYDGRHEQKTMWESIQTDEFVLAANSITSPHTLNAWKGKTLFFNAMQNDDEFATNILPAMYPHLGQLPNMGTVGNGAIFLAHEMGCSPIMTVGMDLCYREKDVPLRNAEPVLQLTEKQWRYRCSDYLMRPNDPEFPDGWRETENKVLYDNDKRMENTFDIEHKGKTYRIDEALKFYANSLLRNIGELDLPVINCSGGVLENYVKSLPLAQAIEEKAKKLIHPGQTTARHLLKIIEDGKRGRVYDPETYWTSQSKKEGGMR